MIIADTNLVTYFSVHSEHSALAEAAYAADPMWAAPLFWRSEFLSMVAKYMRHRGMTLESALLSLRTAQEVIGGREYRVASEKVLQLAGRSECSAYDCEYVALAQDLGVLLVTTDKQLLRTFPKIAVPLEKFAKKK